MKRIALISVVAAAAAMFGLIKPTSAETTVPMEDLALVSETAAPTEEPLVAGVEPLQYPRYQYPRQQYPRMQYPRQQYPRMQYPRQQYPRMQYPRQQYPRMQYPRQQYPRMQYPRQQYPRQQYPRMQYPHRSRY